MHYYLYEIKNNINGKIYVGVHKTKVIDDGYMGSGKAIKAAILKYGIKNFTKTILQNFDSQESMFAREKEVVNEQFLNRDDVYNLRRGGLGGFDHINKNGLNNIKEQCSKGGKAYSKRLNTDSEFKKIISKKISEKFSGRTWTPSFITNPEISKLGNAAATTKEANIKRSTTMKENGHQVGEKNSQSGTMWITNGSENKKIKKNDFVPEGWNKGRLFLNM